MVRRMEKRVEIVEKLQEIADHLARDPAAAARWAAAGFTVALPPPREEARRPPPKSVFPPPRVEAQTPPRFPSPAVASPASQEAVGEGTSSGMEGTGDAPPPLPSLAVAAAEPPPRSSLDGTEPEPGQEPEEACIERAATVGGYGITPLRAHLTFDGDDPMMFRAIRWVPLHERALHYDAPMKPDREVYDAFGDYDDDS